MFTWSHGEGGWFWQRAQTADSLFHSGPGPVSGGKAAALMRALSAVVRFLIWLSCAGLGDKTQEELDALEYRCPCCCQEDGEYYPHGAVPAELMQAGFDTEAWAEEQHQAVRHAMPMLAATSTLVKRRISHGDPVTWLCMCVL